MHLATPFGIPVRLHWTFFVLVAALLAWGAWMAGAAGAFVVGVASLGLFTSVILHELGHALAARRYGIGTHHITLYPFGGVAAIERMPEEPDQEIVIALAGPAVNVVLAALGGWAWLLSDHPLVLGFVMTNVGMAAFNLLPAFPMDGGRVLRAVLTRQMGFLPASRLSVKIGRTFAVAFVAGGLWMFHPSLLLVGLFLFVALRSEEEQLVARNWEETTGRPPPWKQSSSSSTPGAVLWSPR
jgi:Zn-dependent protease